MLLLYGPLRLRKRLCRSSKGRSGSLLISKNSLCFLRQGHILAKPISFRVLNSNLIPCKQLSQTCACFLIHLLCLSVGDAITTTATPLQVHVSFVAVVRTCPNSDLF